MAYQPLKPQPNDNLDVSVTDIQQNFLTSNTVMGIDHYTFDDVTSNKGFHNIVTTPLIVGAVHPVTAAAIPKLYAMQDFATVGIIQYSRGPSNAVPTPVTSLHSPSAPIALAAGATTNVLDFTGMNPALCRIYAFDVAQGQVNSNSVFFGAGFFAGFTASAGSLSLEVSGNVLQLKNNTALPMSVYWTLVFERLQ